jgi:hypothetical protein
MTVKEQREIMFQEIEKHFMVKDFLESIEANVKSPGEKELDMLWRWFIKRKQSSRVIFKGQSITRIHLAMFIKHRYNDSWYMDFQKTKA